MKRLMSNFLKGLPFKKSPSKSTTVPPDHYEYIDGNSYPELGMFGRVCLFVVLIMIVAWLCFANLVIESWIIHRLILQSASV